MGALPKRSKYLSRKFRTYQLNFLTVSLCHLSNLVGFLFFLFFLDTLQSRTRPKEVRNLTENNKLQPLICDCCKVFEAPITAEASETTTAVTDIDGDNCECEAIETVGVSRIACKNKVNDKKSRYRLELF